MTFLFYLPHYVSLAEFVYIFKCFVICMACSILRGLSYAALSFVRCQNRQGVDVDYSAYALYLRNNFSGGTVDNM